MNQFSFANKTQLMKNTNQAIGLAKYSIDFLKNGQPSQEALNRCKMFHTDSVMCGVSALALRTNAPYIFQQEAINESTKDQTNQSARLLGSTKWVPYKKAVLANSSAVREWDSNGTVFGYNANIPGHQAGEFGHNDYYPVVMAAACQNKNINGKLALKAMLLSDEIRGRLAEVFSLKTYKIDHVVHGAIASICTYGALLDAKEEQIESAIGMFVAHYIPFRAIRAGKQLSDSKGASAAISTEAALTCMERAMNGFIGPKDIFRNPESIFRLNEPTDGDAPFNIVLTNEGSEFACMDMHFKLGLYEHQSAGALEGLLKIIHESQILNHDISDISNINIVAYEPAFGIIGDPAKRNPTTRQSADHSMLYIVCTLFNKAFEYKAAVQNCKSLDEVWKLLMLEPQDYSYSALNNPSVRKLMEKGTFTHGGKDYDSKYPEGIPTSLQVTVGSESFDSGFIMFPSGHSKNTAADLENILEHKNQLLGSLAMESPSDFVKNLNNIQNLSNKELQNLYDCQINFKEFSIDSEQYKV